VPSKAFPVELTERAGKFYSKCDAPWVGYHAAVMPTDPDLVRARVRLLLQEADAPARLWRLATGNVDAGWGTGRLCVICDEVIASNQVEYEVRSPSNAVVIIHYSCYVVWRDESGRP
jgi:hypothetical protein